MIRAENVTFDYESMDEEGNVESRKRAVNHVNLEIQSGQFIAVLGHNGSGKSTFAKHINALLTPTEGTLWVEGMNTRDESELWNIRQNAGMAMHPRCIVLDEPTAMLDPHGRKSVIETVKKLNKEEGITVILITHYMEEVIEADHVFVMDDGNLVMDGTPREVFSQVEKLKELRLDVPQATLLAYELQKKGFPLRDGILSNEELVEELCQLKLKM